ncbi:MAG: hypothetical protein J1E83_01715 [Lachnospiraceae bacterium]|nr:hypothetical protein [Lachnospiraceae bacterium]
MKKSIGVMLCICLLVNMLSGCGAKAGTGAASNNLTEKVKAAAFEKDSEPETDDAAGSDTEWDPTEEAKAQDDLKSVALYVAKRGLWEPDDGSVCFYAWSDIDGNGQPELFVAKQPDEGNGYEIHIFMIEEDGNGIRDVSASDERSILTDSFPGNDNWWDYSDEELYYMDSSTYFYYYGSGIVQRNRFCREEDSVFYDSDDNEITYARWQNLNTAFSQGKILSAEKPVWKELLTQSGHLSDEELLEELKTSYDEYLLSMENRDVEEIIDTIRLSHAQNEEENESLLREFTKKAQEGESAQIVFSRYTAEHIPVPVYIDYNGEDFYGIWDESEDPYAESECPYHGFRYAYLKVFLETGEDGIIYETAVLTNEADLSWEDLTGSGDKEGEYPDHLLLYGDIETKDALLLATDIVRIEKGNLIKRNNVYLIEDGTQLELLSEMVVKGEEIEPEIDAAIGIYRLCSDIEARDHLKLGSMRTPFRGCLYGDGHAIAGDFSYARESTEKWNRLDYEYVRQTVVGITIEDAETLDKAKQTLLSYPTESLAIYVAAEDADKQVVIELIKQCWEVNHERNHYFIEITDVTEQTEKSGALQPFFNLFGEEGAALMEQAAEEEDSCISFIRLERVDGLDICTFAVRASEEEQYHLMLAGEWEDTEVSFEHLLIPATDTDKPWGMYRNYEISQADVNFDGKEDLLILEGFAGGSGGGYEEYRAVVWKENKKEFVWYPSFPEMLVFLEFNEQRMIHRYRLGAGYEVVCEYGVVNGEYVMTRCLIWESHLDASALSYYEMDVLVEQYDVTDMDWNEVISLYPDLNYWSQG